MNDPELEKLLKSAPAPERPPEFWEEFPRRISTSAHWRTTLPAASQPSPPLAWQKLAWGISVVAILLLIGVTFWPRRAGLPANGILQNPKLVREVLEMFPNQVQAIEQDENGLRLSLADKPDVPVSTPLWIKVCDGKHCRSFITFSGQSVQMAGQRVEVLADARGGVLLVGERFVWSSEHASSEAGIRIQAQAMNQSL